MSENWHSSLAEWASSKPDIVSVYLLPEPKRPERFELAIELRENGSLLNLWFQLNEQWQRELSRLRLPGIVSLELINESPFIGRLVNASGIWVYGKKVP